MPARIRVALTLPGRQPIIARDDRTASWRARRQTAESSDRGHWRRWLPSADSAVDVRRFGRAARGSDAADPHALARGPNRALRIFDRARKAVFRDADFRIRRRSQPRAENFVRDEFGRTRPRD